MKNLRPYSYNGNAPLAAVFGAGPDWSFLSFLFDRVIEGSLHVTFCFQPIVDLRRACVIGYEALVRFPAEIGLPPDRCFEFAAICGRRIPLEEVVVRTALEARHRIPPNCFLSINVSPTFLLSSRWDAVLEGCPSLSGVVFEITEQDRIEDYPAMRNKLANLRKLDATVAVDDTGSGYASLKHVMELKPNFVKLDRFFVGNCHAERPKSTLIEMIGMATSRLDAWIVAEGVESRAELDELIRLDVPLAQGFFLGRPDAVMKPLARDVELHLHSRIQARTQIESVQRHAELSFTFTNRDVAEVYLREQNGADYAVLVDRWGRPLELLELHPLLGLRSLAPPMKVQRSSPPAEVLQRALTRSAALQFDPFAVIDERGSFRGVVRVDRLMSAVLEATHPEAARGDSSHTTPPEAPAKRTPAAEPAFAAENRNPPQRA